MTIKKTLLQMTQSILSDMDSDEVNSISDTVESLQVAGIIENAYYYLCSVNTFPEHYEIFTLDALGDTDKPSHMQAPTTVTQIEWVRYDVQTTGDTDVNYKHIDYLTPEEFINYVSQRTSSDSNVETVVEDTSVKLLIINDTAPAYWTSFDDEYLVFDSFDNTVDTTMQKSKSMGYGIKMPVFSLTDSYTADIDDHLFPLLLNEAKSQAFIDLKQQANPKAEQRARKVLTKHQIKENKLGKETRFIGPNYGRQATHSTVNFGRE
jgi:hypothetical protein